MKAKQVTLQELWNNKTREMETSFKFIRCPSGTIERSLKKLREETYLKRRKESRKEWEKVSPDWKKPWYVEMEWT